MSWTLFTAGAALPLLLAACQGGTPGGRGPAPPAAIGGDGSVVVLRLDEEATLGELWLVWRELADSRCPIGVECVWEGEAAVTIEVARGDAEPERVKLVLRAGAAPATAEVAGVDLRLMSVEPYPRDGVVTARTDHRATVEIGGL